MQNLLDKLLKFFILSISAILGFFLTVSLSIFINSSSNATLFILIIFPLFTYFINKAIQKKFLRTSSDIDSPRREDKNIKEISANIVDELPKRKSKKWTTKGRAIETLQWELEDLVHDDIRLVASAYRSSISSNSFGKKNYTKFKRELLEHLLDNTDSKDVLYYAQNLGDFEVPDHTIFEIERAINDFTKDEEFDDEMDPYVYEHFCAEQFLIAGWDDAEATSGSSDQGVDVIAKRGDDFLVGQCKKYQKPVGNSAVQEIVAGMGYYGANIGVVISNAGYTNSAKKLAEANNIKLIHHAEIKNL